MPTEGWESDPDRIAAKMIGFPEARVLSVEEDEGGLHVAVETVQDAARYTLCGVTAVSEGRAVAGRSS